MQLTPYIVTYDGMSYSPHLATAAKLLVNQECDFGEAVVDVEIFVHVNADGPVTKGLEFMKERFQRRLSTLPKIWFRRKRRLIEIAYESHVSEASLKTLREGRFVREFLAEIGSVLSLMKKRVSKSDEFSLDEFLFGVSNRIRRFEELSDDQLLVLISVHKNTNEHT